MSTAVDEDIELWLKGEVEKICQMSLFLADGSFIDCDAPADWLLSGKCCYTRSKFACTPCKERAVQDGTVCWQCFEYVDLLWIERMK